MFFNRLFEHWERHSFGVWILRNKENGDLIEQCGLRWCYEDNPEIEMVYAIAPSYWGKAIATEAAKASIIYGEEQLTPDYIMAITAPTNYASHSYHAKSWAEISEKCSLLCYTLRLLPDLAPRIASAMILLRFEGQSYAKIERLSCVNVYIED